MSRRVCKACGGEFLSGTRCLVLTPTGNAMSIVCQGCARGGVIVVPRKTAPVVKRVETASDDLDRARRLLESYVKGQRRTLHMLPTPPCASVLTPEVRHAHAAGRLEGLEAALEVLKKIGQPS